MKYIQTIIVLFFIITCVSCSNDDSSEEVESKVEVITYQSSDEIFTNPERGFMHTLTVNSEGAALKPAYLNSLKNENISIILRLYYLDQFKETAMSETQLNLIKTDFSRFRDAGIKCVLRFAYTDDTDDGTDAAYEIVETHLDQLQPIFEDNADVIAFVQAGFIGAWGEWHSSSNNLDKKKVMDKLLEVVPSGIKIQLRTPVFKQQIFDYTTAISTDVGYGTTDIARVGFHNDCFLSSVDDMGTYVTDVDTEKLYISREAFFVPTGGETCPPSGIPSASCGIADAEMKLLKWTYLNIDYYAPVLNLWRNNSCFEDFERELGYRLSLKSSALKDEVVSNDTFELSVIMDNLGFAPVYNAKNSFLVFRSLADGTLYKKALDFDVRYVVPEVSYQITENVSTSGIPVGDYELLLKIEDASEGLKDRPEYSIRLANAQGVWEEETGLNKLLHTLTIK